MFTQLASQLRKIHVDNADSIDFSSILFSPSQAKKYSLQSIYAMGRNGIMELIRIDNNFARFEDTLFGNKMVSTDRALLTDTENKEIDNQIRDYLFSVAPYMLLKSTQKTLEYLIRRFSIHTFNAEDFFLAVLPFHETTLFPRVVQICKLESHLFDFLAGVKKSGTPIIRSSLSFQCMKDFALLEFILNGLRSLNEHGTIPVVHLTLLCSLVVDISRSGKLQEEYVRALIAFASKGFASSNSEFQATGLLILAQVAVNVSLNNEIITACLNNILRNADCNMSQLVECLLLLFRNNTSYSIPLETAETFLSNPTFEMSLSKLAERVSVFPIIAALASAHCQLLLRDDSTMPQLTAIAGCVRQNEASEYIALYLTQLASHLQSDATPAVLDRSHSLLLALSAQFSEAFDVFISALPADTPLKQQASAVFSGGSHMLLKNGRSLFLSITSDDAATQEEVCSLLVEQLDAPQASEKEFVRNSLTTLLRGGTLPLVRRILAAGEKLLVVFPADPLARLLLEVLATLHARRLADPTAPSVAEMALNGLAGFLRPQLAALDAATALSAHVLLLHFLLEDSTPACRAAVCSLLPALPGPFAAHLQVDPAQSLKDTLQTLTAALGAVDGAAVMALSTEMLKEDSPVALLFAQALLASITHASNKQAAFPAANLLMDYAKRVLAATPAEVSAQVKVTVESITASKTALLTDESLHCTGVQRVLTVLQLAFLDMKTMKSVNKSQTDFEQCMKESCNPYSVLCFCYTEFTPQKSFFMVLANAVCSDVWKKMPSLPFISMLSFSNETPIVMHCLNKLTGLIPEMTITLPVLENLLMCVMSHLTDPVLAVRSTALLVLEALKKVAMDDSMDSQKKRKNSLDKSEKKLRAEDASSMTDAEKRVVLVQLLQYILACRNDIRDDGKLFAIKLNVLLTGTSPAVPVLALSAVLLPLILARPARAQRTAYLALFAKLPYHPSSEEAVIAACKSTFAALQAAARASETTSDHTGDHMGEETTGEMAVEIEQAEVDEELMQEWRAVLRVFFQAMANTTAHHEEFKQVLYTLMREPCVLLHRGERHAAVTDVLTAITPSVFAAMNPAERLLLVHSLLLLVPYHRAVDAVVIYRTINQFDMSLGLLADECRTILAMPAGTADEESLQVQMITALVETITRSARFASDVQVLDVLQRMLERLVAVVRAHRPQKDSMAAEDRAGVARAESDQVVSDRLGVFYPIQIILEALYGLVKQAREKEVVTEDDAATAVPGSKRVRRNSVSIQTEISLSPQLLVDIVSYDLTAQISKASLLLMATLASLKVSAIDACMFQCFKDLTARVIQEQDEESFRVMTSIITFCLRSFTDTHKMLQICQIFLSCVAFVPYSQSVQLLNALLGSIPLRYVGHIMLYLLLLSHSVALQEGVSIMDSEDLEKRRESFTTNASRFVTSIFLGISLNPQIQALGVLACFAEMITEPTNRGNSGKVNRTRELTDILLQTLPTASWDTDRVVDVCSAVVEFVRTIVSSQSFINTVVSNQTEGAQVIQQFFIQIIEHLLLLLQNISVSKEAIGEAARGRAKTEEEVSRIVQYRALEASLYDCVTVMSEVMSVQSLLSVLSVLICHDDSNLRKRALIILNKKLSEGVEDLTEDECGQYIGFVADLAGICNNPEESCVNKQTALLSLHVLVQFFAASHPEAFLPSVHTVVKIITNTTDTSSEAQAMKGSAYIVLSMLCSQLGMKMLPFLPRIIPPLLKDLAATCDKLQALKKEVVTLPAEDAAQQQKQKQLDETYVLIQGLISSLTSVVTYQGSLLSAYLRKMLVVVLAPVLVASDKPVVGNAIHVLFTLLSENIGERVLLPALYDAAKEIDRDSADSLCGLYDLVKCVCDTMSEASMTTHHERLWAFCVSGLETRSRWDAARPEADQVEKAVVRAMVAICLKLNEVQLNALLMRTVSWMEEKSVSNVDASGEGKHVAEQDLPPTSKAIPVFTLVVELSETFKSIFTPFYGQFFQTMVNFVTAFNKNCRRDAPQSQSQLLLFKLIKLVVLAFYKCFLYNSEGWIDEEKFKMASGPLVKMLGAYFVPDYETEYPKFANSFVIPTAVQLVVCTSGHDDWWIGFNHEVLIQTRSPVKEVKLAAMKVIHECFARMSQEYLPLLPDTIPYLADLLEDEDAQVEKAAQDLRVQLESVSGEELTSYLTMWCVCCSKQGREGRG